jgi:hypothetical protein
VVLPHADDQKRILEIMLDIAAFHDFAGYQVQLEKLCRGDYDVGKLVYGNHLVTEVGEITEFVTTSRNIECINDVFKKAIAMMHEYQSKEEFVKCWEKKCFRGVPNNSLYRNIYLGKKAKVLEFDNSFGLESDYFGQRGDRVGFYSNRAQFHKTMLEEFWDTAEDHVHALLLVDALKVWSQIDCIHCRRESFDFGFGWSKQN